MKLCLGTVQFGMDYGVQRAGQIRRAGAMSILEFAVKNGVSGIDTAPAYGTAEEIVGLFLNLHADVRDNAEITSKLPPDALKDKPQEEYLATIRESLLASLRRLKTDRLDVYLLHNPSHVYSAQIVDALQELKKEGLVKKIGVSAYSAEEACKGIELGLDVIQIPYSILDQRMDKAGVIELAQRKGTEVHARSIFTQGLILIDEQDVPKHLEIARPIIKSLAEFCRDHNISRLQLAIAFAGRLRGISSIVFGVDRIEQLMDIIAAGKQTVPSDILEEAKRLFSIPDEDIILPNRWKSNEGGCI